MSVKFSNVPDIRGALGTARPTLAIAVPSSKRQRTGALQNLAEFVAASNRAKRPGVSALRSSESQNGHGMSKSTRWAVAATEDGRQSSGALGRGGGGSKGFQLFEIV